VALVPPAVVTVRSTVPAACAGDDAVIDVSLFTVNDAAAVAPKLTALAPVNPVPVIVTEVPPAGGPLFGETLVTVGAATNVNWSAALVALVPPIEVTVTSTVAAACAGDVALIDVSEFTVNDAAAVPPKLTADAPVNPVPVIVTEVPPAAGPLFGETLVTAGAATKVNWSPALVALVPPIDATVTSTVPAACAGDDAVIDVSLLTVKVVADEPPKLTAEAPAKPVPVIVTLVPPAVEPVFGLTLVTVGAFTKLN
jgi:hypothetical protein